MDTKPESTTEGQAPQIAPDGRDLVPSPTMADPPNVPQAPSDAAPTGAIDLNPEQFGDALAIRGLNRDQLLEMSHNRSWEPFDRSIDIRIARLRRKVEPDPSKPQTIKTVRGAGYISGLSIVMQPAPGRHEDYRFGDGGLTFGECSNTTISGLSDNSLRATRQTWVPSRRTFSCSFSQPSISPRSSGESASDSRSG